VEKALAAGIEREAADAIAAKREPLFHEADERISYQFSMELLRNHFTSEETFEAARNQFGIEGVIEMVACIGNFSMLAMLLNAFLVDLKASPPFSDIGTRPYER
jgi:4-carboxymuconolactone decarboxylase